MDSIIQGLNYRMRHPGLSAAPWADEEDVSIIV